MAPRPRPILKQEIPTFHRTIASALPFTTCASIMSPHVHFPPTPRLISTHDAHSPATYDRAPIIVSPNYCQLPERGARRIQSTPIPFEVERKGRGRSRSRGRNVCRADDNIKGSYFHPRAYEACQPEPLLHSPLSPIDLSPPPPPPLVRDLSPSDESDDSVTIPPDPKQNATILSPPPHNSHTPLSSPTPRSQASAEIKESRSHFLPYSAAGLAKPNKRRPNFVRIEGGRSDFHIPSLALDEGCLGGF